MAVLGVAFALVATTLLPAHPSSIDGACANALAESSGPAVELLVAACGLADAELDGPAAEKVEEAIVADPLIVLPAELERVMELQRVRRLVGADNLGAARSALDCLLADAEMTGPAATSPACPPGTAGTLSQAPVDLAFLLDPYAEAERLLDLRRREEAIDSARATLSRYPRAPVPARVSSALKADNAWYAAWPRRLQPVVDGTVTALEFAAASALVVLVLAGLALRLAGRRGRRILEFVPGFGWFLHLRVSVPPAEVGDASNLNPAGLAVVAADRLASPGADSPSIEIVRDSSAATGVIASLGSVAPAVGALTAAGGWLLPGRTVALETFLHPVAGTGGVDRITVSLKDPGGLHSGTATLSLDAAEAGGAIAFALVERGADWAAFTLDPRSATSQSFSSHAEFLEGARLEQMGDAEKASPHYRRALDLDPANHAAALNLYGRPMGAGSVFEPGKLSAVRHQIDAEADRKPGRRRSLPSSRPSYWDYPIWYRLRYLELVTGLNALSEDPPKVPREPGAGAGGESLVPDICQFLLGVRTARRTAVQRCRFWRLARRTSNTSFYRRRIAHLQRLDQLLDTIEPSVMLLLAAAHLREGRYPSRLPDPARERFSRELAKTIKGGDSDPSQLLAAVLGRDDLPAQASYNLACYLSALGERLPADAGAADPYPTAGDGAVLGAETEEALDRSLEALRRAYQGMETAERGRLVAWAPEDPSLRHLRTERPREFGELLASFSPHSA